MYDILRARKRTPHQASEPDSLARFYTARDMAEFAAELCHVNGKEMLYHLTCEQPVRIKGLDPDKGYVILTCCGRTVGLTPNRIAHLPTYHMRG
jgi:hypothetical protein